MLIYGADLRWLLRSREVRQHQRDQCRHTLNEEDLFTYGLRAVKTGDHHAAQKEQSDFATCEGRRMQNRPDQTRRQKPIVQTLVRRKYGGVFRLLFAHAKRLHPPRSRPKKHLEDEKVNVQQSNEARRDVRESK